MRIGIEVDALGEGEGGDVHGQDAQQSKTANGIDCADAFLLRDGAEREIRFHGHLLVEQIKKRLRFTFQWEPNCTGRADKKFEGHFSSASGIVNRFWPGGMTKGSQEREDFGGKKVNQKIDGTGDEQVTY